MKILGIIPARYASTRLPGKPLADILGKPMIQWVYENAAMSKYLKRLVVATDDERIRSAVESFGGEAVMTSESIPSGTDRCGAVIQLLDEPFDFVINIQGDEPLLRPAQIDELASILNPRIEIASQMHALTEATDLFSDSVVKVVVNAEGEALYFSREPIPHLRGVDKKDWLLKSKYFQHVGMYAYRADVLHSITRLSPSPLELSESLEQLRWLENGYRIRMAETAYKGISVDNPADLEAVISYVEAGKNG